MDNPTLKRVTMDEMVESREYLVLLTSDGEYLWDVVQFIGGTMLSDCPMFSENKMTSEIYELPERSE